MHRSLASERWPKRSQGCRISRVRRTDRRSSPAIRWPMESLPCPVPWPSSPPCIGVMSNGGTGQVIDNAIVEANYRLIDYMMLDYEKLGIIRERTGNRLGDLAPRNSYQTADGGWVAISGGTQGIVERLFRCMGREDLLDDPRFANNAERIKNVDALDEAIGAWMIQHPMEHVLTLFEQQEISGAPVNNTAQIAANDHFRARDLLLSIDDPDLGLTSTVHVHPRMSATPGGVKWLGGAIGRDNEAFYLDEVGLSREELDALREAGAV